MDERIRKLLEKQAEWQESRKDLSWEEKVRMIQSVREDFARWVAAAATPKASDRNRTRLDRGSDSN